MNSEKKKKTKSDEENICRRLDDKQQHDIKAKNDVNDTNHNMKRLCETHRDTRKYVNAVEKNENQEEGNEDFVVLNVSRNHI